ncbi:hypothetical protein M231_00600 [Tremella mesenterica]|uniref:PLP-dependent transferase n=1 Tax=Tremella mesenterica TaxID=5217 RepID=A0A4Q1BVS7_TREME|nr:hypothetical protein M231_00600 [Tremella mesenterica]
MSSQDQHEFEVAFSTVVSHILHRNTTLSHTSILPSRDAISTTLSSLPETLPEEGRGTDSTMQHLFSSVLPGILQAQNGPRYFGFVVGGVTPAAQLTDMLLSSYDENVQVYMPNTTASVAIEARTLELALDLLHISRDAYQGRTITTGATASNVLGLACARDHLYANYKYLPPGYSLAQRGPPSVPNLTGPPIIILGLHPHFSILKAAALVGIGAGPEVVQQLSSRQDDELAIDLEVLEKRLKEEREVGRGVIVTYGLGEVNTGGFGQGLPEVARICKRYDAWLHVDGAFGGFAGVVPELRHLVEGIDQADSLTLDGHKWLNVPYDTGLFYTRTPSLLTNVLAPPTGQGPAYLSTGDLDIPSPLYMGIENSRRFRALPLLASLLSLGREGYVDIIRRNVSFAQNVARFLLQSDSYELLNPIISQGSHGDQFENQDESTGVGKDDQIKDRIVSLNIVLFRGSSNSIYPPSDLTSARRLTEKINSTGKMYVSSTVWRGLGAVRIAVSNWRTGDEDLIIVKDVLDGVMNEKI